MQAIKPAGSMDWLLRQIGNKQWSVITSSSFEPRCKALFEWMQVTRLNLKSVSIHRIENPASAQWTIAKPNRDILFSSMLEIMPNARVVDSNLLDNFGAQSFGEELERDESILLDITTFPKRYFYYLLKLYLKSPQVLNLVVSYTRPESYSEDALYFDAQAPNEIEGFGRVDSEKLRKLRLALSVGYLALSVDDMMAQARAVGIDFILPFPPASPHFRRNWRLLSDLLPEEQNLDHKVHRIDALDAFEVCDRVLKWNEANDYELLPLGPKPHALGLAMAALCMGGRAKVVYPQPTAYNPHYSAGIARTVEGHPDTYGYCLKRNGLQLFP